MKPSKLKRSLTELSAVDQALILCEAPHPADESYCCCAHAANLTSNTIPDRFRLRYFAIYGEDHPLSYLAYADKV